MKHNKRHKNFLYGIEYKNNKVNILKITRIRKDGKCWLRMNKSGLKIKSASNIIVLTPKNYNNITKKNYKFEMYSEEFIRMYWRNQR